MTRFALRGLWVIAPMALLALASCSSQPAATDPEKTAVVVPKEANTAADSTANATDTPATKMDSTAR